MFVGLHAVAYAGMEVGRIPTNRTTAAQGSPPTGAALDGGTGAEWPDDESRPSHTKITGGGLGVVQGAALASAVGGSIGLASGVIGIGGGIFLSPILMLNKWASAKEAAATASLFIWMNSLAGLAGAGLSGRLEIDLGLLFPFSLAVLLGGLIGSRHGSQVSSQTSIRGLLVVILIVAAVRRIIGTTV